LGLVEVVAGKARRSVIIALDRDDELTRLQHVRKRLLW
jgi:hypothetical protein